ncbi:nucleotidyltransferase domain-containing protein [Limibacterium fermenti]|jgi:predicted nucleotidyltransferase|uniref:nucleotidyltransferase domain-containing protein n=1 Tax=Limibacterium fermenti TaxID=3229863 RepID=UPI0026872402
MMDRDLVINSIRRTLNGMQGEIDVILYGSQARGDARPDSDVDLLLIVNKDRLTEKERQDIINPLFAIEYQTGVLINPVVILKKQWEANRTPFYENIMKEGIALC